MKIKNKSSKKRSKKIPKRKYKKTFRKKVNTGLRKLSGGDFNIEQKQELLV